ncbi:Single-stranded DNA-specific exonuclease [Archaeoglobus sulfaticallidus PM70-1]|uniref:Single-stranded DNA-specific exonuclease n=1 Tax=Archaeoglobus sulfaticallidus PM70-1 TaxID=387631 RepID=N0BD47_9EURY|nr:DHH family phosphoesterase [Archaeoglobus sulfaticallidus]AGK60167.1 Single-stranded DNA-specific exonuclease [Archaeoglobus sulfaticallidus PM70-1]
MQIPDEMLKRAEYISSLIKRSDEVLIVTHIDADGITSGSIARITLDRLGIENEVVFVKQLSDSEIEKIADENKFTWFTDLGSGQINSIIDKKIDFVITDHHLPVMDNKRQLNPHSFGFDGSYELSGATTTYILSRYLGNRLFAMNVDLIPLSIVGAVGDLQDSREGRLLGLNRIVIDEGIKRKVLAVHKDLRFFGKQTRPVVKMLEYTFDPYLPGISGNEAGAINFLDSLGIEVSEWKKWIDLSEEERKRAVNEIVKLCISAGIPFKSIKRIVGETYILSHEEEGTELRDAMEFSTLLNATARYGYEDVGLKVCLGDRDGAFKRARTLLQNHRRNLSEGIRLVDEIGIVELENIQYFDAKDMILDTIVGIVAGMCFSKANLNKPIIALARNDEGIKVSARATQRLVDRGVNLAKAIKLVSEKIGGKGGGHSIAAGALIPESEVDRFLKELDRVIGQQLARA